MIEPLPDNLPFEEAMLALERTVRELEEGQLGLDDALARYEQGVRLIKLCYGQLRHAEQRILLLTGTDESGQPLLQPSPPRRPTPPDPGTTGGEVRRIREDGRFASPRCRL
jgi:exodeoxyribonuclease VII small subunit